MMEVFPTPESPMMQILRVVFFFSDIIYINRVKSKLVNLIFDPKRFFRKENFKKWKMEIEMNEIHFKNILEKMNFKNLSLLIH